MSEYGRLRDSEYFRIVIDLVERYNELDARIRELEDEYNSLVYERNLRFENIRRREPEIRAEVSRINSELNRIYNRFTRGLKIEKPPRRDVDARISQLKRLMRAWVAYAYRASNRGISPVNVGWRSRSFRRELIYARREASKKYHKRVFKPEEWSKYRIPSLVYEKYFGEKGIVTELLLKRNGLLSELHDLYRKYNEIREEIAGIEDELSRLYKNKNDIVDELENFRFDIFRVKIRLYNIPKRESGESPTGMFQGFYDVIAVMNDNWGEVIQDWWFFNMCIGTASTHMVLSFNEPMAGFGAIEYVLGHTGSADGLESVRPSIRNLILGYADISPVRLETIPDHPVRCERIMLLKKGEIEYDKQFRPELVVESDLENEVPNARAEIETLRDTVENILVKEGRIE